MDEASKVVLLRLGYRVQDMEAKFGPNAYAGRWRWIHLPSGQHQHDGNVSLSEADAWRNAQEHASSSIVADHATAGACTQVANATPTPA